MLLHVCLSRVPFGKFVAMLGPDVDCGQRHRLDKTFGINVTLELRCLLLLEN